MRVNEGDQRDEGFSRVNKSRFEWPSYRLGGIGTCAILVLSSTVALGADEPPTLRERLDSLKLPTAGWEDADLALPIVSADRSKQPGIQAIAYSVFRGADAYPKEVRIAVYNAATNQWKRGVVDCSDERWSHANCGSILGLWCAKDFYYVVTHLNPSCNPTLVASIEFKPLEVIAGDPIALFADGSTIFYKCEVHFAPVHPLELVLYDPRTKEQRPLYPTKSSGPVRRAHIEELRKVFASLGDDWFRNHNRPRLPEVFSEGMPTDPSLSLDEDAIAFQAVYYGSDLDPATPGDHSDKNVYVICIFRQLHMSKRTEYREFRTEDLKKLVSFDKVEELVSRENLDRIFALPYP